MTKLTTAENYAAGLYLTEWPDDMDYDQLCDALCSQHPDVIVWEPFEDYDHNDVIEFIEAARVAFLRAAEPTEEASTINGILAKLTINERALLWAYVDEEKRNVRSMALHEVRNLINKEYSL